MAAAAAITSVLQNLGPYTLTYAILAILLVRYALSTLRTWAHLRHIPGPFFASFSQLWYIGCVYRNTLHLDLAAVCKKYGPLARVTPTVLVTNSPDIVKRMSAVRSPYTKSDWYEATKMHPRVKHLFAETDEQTHSEMRSRMAQGYSGRELGNAYLEETIDANLKRMFAVVEEKYTSTRSLPNGSTKPSSADSLAATAAGPNGSTPPPSPAADPSSAGGSATPQYKPCDLARLLHYFVVDTITDIAFRQPFGMLAADADVNNYISTQEALLPAFEWISAIPWLQGFLGKPGVAKYVMPKPTDKAGLGFMMGLAQRTVSERFEPDGKPKKELGEDMLGSFLKHGIGREQAEQEVLLQVAAGTDTTVTSLRAIVLYLITNPLAYARLTQDLRARSFSHPHLVTDAEARSIPYLQACIREAVRMFPPVTGLMSKRVPAGGDTLAGYFVPGGTSIAYVAWDFFKDRDVFGDDADIFRPERWLECDEDRRRKMQGVWDLVFGYGKYICLGKPLAQMELGKVVAEIFRRYDIVLVNPLRPWKSYNRNGFFFQSELWVRIMEREQ